jgi:dihydropteroate synthase
MGILNVTPDSFADGGRFCDPAVAVAHGLGMVKAGARILDVGGESTRPGAAAVGVEEEVARVVPVIRELSERVAVPISIDTQKAAVAEAALTAGARIVNDVSGLQRDPAMVDVLRQSGAGCVLMHMRGTPETMQQFTCYDDLVEDILAHFREVLEAARAAGLEGERFMIDPGIGFSKTAEQNLTLLAHLGRFRELGRPVLVGPSRKSFIGKVLSLERPADRLWGTAAAVATAVLHGADVIRVHDVAEMHQVAALAAAVRNAL